MQPQHSCIYKGTVWHQRHQPRVHAFRYSLFMMYVDLDELEQVFKPFWLWGVNRPGFASFQRKDHYGDDKTALSNSIRELVLQQTQQRVEGPIRLLTQFRILGYTFNPLSLYFCFDMSGEKLTHIVSEVSNTPWNVQHCYVLTPSPKNPTVFQDQHEKSFHVSPFMHEDMQYRWKISQPEEKLEVQIENLIGNEILFSAKMDLERKTLNTRNLRSTLSNFPLMSFKVITAIYWEALKLWLKGIKYVPYTKP